MLGADVGSAETALHELIAKVRRWETLPAIYFVQGEIRLDAGIVYQYVDPVEASRNSLDHFRHFAFLAYIRFDTDHIRAEKEQLSHGSMQELFVVIDDGHLAASVEESVRT
jgi:hypothetical protein